MKRKGITPVIAVVLLLLITVGAVASAWGLYQNIISDQSQLDQLNAQQRASQTEISFQSVVENDGSTEIYLQNTGSRAINVSRELELLVSPPGEQGYVPFSVANDQFGDSTADGSTTCFTDPSVIMNVSGSYDCDTGMNFPQPSETLGIRINYRNAGSTAWNYDCSPQTSGTSTC